MNVQFSKLGDLVDIKGGGTPSRVNPIYWSGNIPWATVKDLKGTVLSSTEEHITQAGVENSATTIIPKNTVIMATRMGLGKVAINKVPLAINQDLKALVAKDELDHNFLFHFILSQASVLSSFGKGATVKGITLDIVKNLKIPKYPLAEQRRIAAILDKADAIRRKRAETIKMLDQFLRSVFLEMFGDPVRNEKGWEVTTLNKICTKITDGEHINPTFVDQGIPMVMAKQVLSETIDFEDVKYVTEEVSVKFRKKCAPQPSDILLVSRGATIGRCTEVNSDRPFCLMGSVILIKPHSKFIDSSYLNSLLKHPAYQSKLYSTSSSSAQQAIYLTHIKDLSVILPPIDQQKIYRRIVDYCRHRKQLFDSSSGGMEVLFNALTQRAFRGEL